MHCASCVASIKTALKDVLGIRSVAVNLATKQAEIERIYRSEKIN
ncbi:hypothetical protein B1F79_04385 [Coxiella-like endosymbiont of Rhipicephalus sanguineus]|nr:hypothetical protein [Coxiella-like endosymbiont of Rhipicephalus sanguineus]